MTEIVTGAIQTHFKDLADPRIDRRKAHLLMDIIVIAICAVISGADGWTDVEEYGKAKFDWLKTFLELPNGIPSHDTFGRVFSRLSAKAFQECFLNWVHAVYEITDGQVIAIDGKTLRRSHDRGAGVGAIQMVSAWASANQLVLGQVKTDAKSNEITAIPELLRVLELHGCIVMIDAAGCQKAIADQIREQGGDYVLALKGNQSQLHDDVKLFFENARAKNFKDQDAQFHETIDGNHGRVEVRRYWTVSDIDWIDSKDAWRDLQTIGMVESERHVGDKVTTETRYYISSLPSDAKLFGSAVRDHWGVENGLHWRLDIAFREDECRVRKGHAPQNFAVLRHIALNLLKHETTCRRGMKAKRLKAGWNNDYLLKVLGSVGF